MIGVQAQQDRKKEGNKGKQERKSVQLENSVKREQIEEAENMADNMVG